LTHTHHRRGNKASLEEDYILLAMTSRGYNDCGTSTKLKQILEICAKYHPVNAGCLMKGQSYCLGRGTPIEEIINKTTSQSIIHAIYDSKKAVKSALKDIKDADFGISIVISGIFDDIFQMANDLLIKQPCTVNISLGILGNTKDQPPEAILELMTMCGHSLISKKLIKDQINRVGSRTITAHQAADELARQCVCGLFNTTRAVKLIEKYVENDTM